jgi:D-alanyl-D-alanine carboxypeptidase/LysM repeat protein
MLRIAAALALLMSVIASGCSAAAPQTSAVAAPTLEPLPVAVLVPTVIPDPTPVVPIRIHTVRAGDTLPLLSERYAVSLPTLRAANELDDADQLTVGQQLRVPTVEGAVHTLRPGETLRELAEWYGVPLSTLIEANRLSNPDVIAVDTPVLIPGVAPTLRRPPSTPTPQPTLVPTPEAPTPIATESAGAVQVIAAAPPARPAPRRVADTPPPDVTAQNVAVLDETSGALLYGQAEHARVAPASITKIATTLVALEREPNLSRRIEATISGSAMAARDGSSIMGLEPGEDVSLTTLLFGMMLPSGNDAAEQVAVALAGSRETFVGWMNHRISRLGLRDTSFANPSGMDASGHYSSAYDMALLGREAMRNSTFRGLAGAQTYSGDGFRLSNLNRLIGVYPGADGIKIGSTRRAGKTIVASAVRNGHRVYIALLRSADLPGDSTRLFNWTWNTFSW